jgi:hypothetical protein
MEALMNDVRKMPLFRQVIPMEAGVGWPVPRQPGGEQSKVYVTLPFFGFSQTKAPGQTSLTPPFATMTLDWATQVPVEFVNLRFHNPWPEGQWEGQVGVFPHAAVAGLTVGEYKARRSELLGMYDHMMATLAANRALTPEWSAEFSALLRTLMEPGLEPYYRAIGPKFFGHFLPPLPQAAR